jgi:hypothetical protein
LEVLLWVIPRQTGIDTLIDCVEQFSPTTKIGPEKNRCVSTLVTTPIFTDLALDVPCAKTTFEIDADDDVNLHARIALVVHRVQNAKVFICSVWHHWMWLAAFAKNVLAFHLFRRVEFRINGHRAVGVAAQLFMAEMEETKPIVIRAKELTWTLHNWGYHRAKTLPNTEELTNMLGNKLIEDSE